ncbi:MAG: hypothetical protein M0Z66_14300 [Thermaerobacter sp.]|nr:hypothetical protein [Thermaerobacter sp.]
MNRYAAASGVSLLAAALAALWLALTRSPFAAMDLRIWLGYGAAGFLAAGVGLEIVRSGAYAPPHRFSQVYLWSAIAGIALLSLPPSGRVAGLHRLGWLGFVVSAVDYAYLIWWRPPMPAKQPEAFGDVLVPGKQLRRSDPVRDGVARAMVAAGPAYLFLVAVAGIVTGNVLGSRSELLLLFGWLSSLSLGGALYIWPRLLAHPAGSRHLARWGAALWHLGLVLSVITLRTWLLGLTGLGALLLLADLAPTLRGVRRGRPYVVGSRRRYPKVGARIGFVLAALLLLALSLSPLLPQGVLAWQRILSIAFAVAANLTLLHHLRPVFGAQFLRARGGWMPSLLALSTLGLGAFPTEFAAAAAVASIYLAASWLPGLPLRPQKQEERRTRRPV